MENRTHFYLGLFASALITAPVSAWAQAPPDGPPDGGTPACAAVNTCPDPKTFTGPFEAQVSKLNVLINEKDDVIHKLQGDIAAKSNEIASLATSLKAKTTENNNLLSKLSTIDEEKTRLGNILAEQQADAAASKARFDQNTARILTASASDKAKLQADGEKLRQQSESDQSALQKTRKELKLKSDEADSVSQKLKEANDDRTKIGTDLKDAQLAAEAKDQLLARNSAHLAVAVVAACALLPVVIIGLYLGSLRSKSSKDAESALIATYKRVALKLRQDRDGEATTLHLSEEHLLDDLASNRTLLRGLKVALMWGVGFSIVGSVALTFTGIWFLRNASLGQEHVDLIKGATWQALIGLFTPVAALIAAVSLAQTKYKDAVSHCLAAELIYKPSKR